MSQKMQELSLTDPNVLDQIKLPARQGGVGSRPLGGVNGPVTPSGSLTPSEVSLIAASEPPLAWDREQDLMLSPFSPRSQLSGRFTPTFGNRPSDPQLSPSPGTSSKVKGIFSVYTYNQLLIYETYVQCCIFLRYYNVQFTFVFK
eukprot:TRINITY_DN1826_c1_g1_i3.p2 TRINITY_DN1826_c1_g1~~TRINITY_DN1826_c1_g1_i3.p2  ORF type:complete len:145 (+),score=14.60 TRINITY_DN1826_c1_g1_i3:52-486(+)